MDEEEQEQVLILSPEEMEWLLDLLSQPPREPTPAMLRASQRRKELLGEDEDEDE